MRPLVVATLPGYQLLDSLAVEQGGLVCVATMVNGAVTRRGGIDTGARPGRLVRGVR